MRHHRILKLIFCFLFICVVACSGSMVDSVEQTTELDGTELSMGTIVGSSSTPKKTSVFPDFKEHIAEIPELTEDDITVPVDYSEQTKMILDRTILKGGVNLMRMRYEQTMSFGEAVYTAWENSGITVASIPQGFTLEQEVFLGFIQAKWDVEIILEDEVNVRMFFKRNGTIYGTYLVVNDADVVPSLREMKFDKGIFAFVDPYYASKNETNRVVIYNFDISDTNRRLMLVREDSFRGGRGDYYPIQVFSQCNDSECIYVCQDIMSQAPKRKKYEYRVYLNQQTGSGCILPVQGKKEGLVFEDPIMYKEDQGSFCPMTTPYWGDKDFAHTEMLMRVEDLSPIESAFSTLFDGSNTSGWLLLNKDVQEKWLKGDGLDVWEVN